MLIRQQLEDAEQRNLAGYGMKSRDSRGRAYPDEEPPYRTAFQRDRDRIIHTTAFRRLEYKTQVFVNTEGDYYRTRLTHTVEVAQIARTLARALLCNEDLAEGIALAHDLGHTPFGHSGEETMHALMRDHGGFNHNTQTLRIVEELEERYDDYPGLNLTWEFREGIIKHETSYDKSDAVDYEPDLQPTLEAQLVNFADEIAYTTHDLDDGLRSSMLDPADLRGVELWREALDALTAGDIFNDMTRHRIIRHLVNVLVSDVVAHTLAQLEQQSVMSVDDLRRLPAKIANYSPSMIVKNKDLKGALFERLYRHHRVMRMSFKARHILTQLFHAYCAEPLMLPEATQRRRASAQLERVVCDYIAGMTDRFAMQEYQKLFNPEERV
ncbi:MAG: deoxyguanosinetriphosphate triphosphohydrolase [Chloroflexi bacterium]|nr:deoxyguanosinetriphosphate triphosphohydrolase [Chloroflexota bacterium]MBI3732758.1 deoxyguanosinetriphosphate triphosphohydrolase [Chloroflexota bacterium]